LKSLKQDGVKASKACSHLVKEVRTELEEIEDLQVTYQEKAQSVYSMCANMAYAHAESYMPSMVKIATSCQMESFKRAMQSSLETQKTE